MDSQNMFTYKGRLVIKSPFRAYVYGPNKAKKLVESFGEFKKHIDSGEWFESMVVEEKEDKKESHKSYKKSKNND